MRVTMTQGHETEIDDADCALIDGFHVAAHLSGGKVYARLSRVVSGRRELVYLHRLITGAPPGLDVDHIDGNGLNNRRANLRVVSRTINNLNRPLTRGCYFEARTGRWRADIWAGGIRHRLGRFQTETEARTAYLVKRAEFITGG